ncbi:MAG: type 4a pilus biogenesis protein PilO [Sandaracinaceae bacterium]
MAAPAQKASSDQAFAKLPAAAKAGIGVGLVAVIAIIYYFAFHMSVTDDLEQARNQYVTLQSQMSAAQERNAEYVRLREELGQREGLDRANLRALPAEAETASFLQDLNRLAELSGLSIRLVEPRPEEVVEHYVKLPVGLRLTGRYHQLARFFYNVSRLDRLISMEDIHLSQPQVEGEEVRIDVDVLATTFRRPDENDQTDPTAAAPAAGTGG